MEIVVNGVSRQVAPSLTLRALLESLRLPTLESGIAVCVNREVVRKEEWSRVALKERDEVEVVQATQGG
jgi:sulfur carrier protein